MKTIADLGKLVKRKYPEYDDLSDEEVGRLIKKKYPDQYADYADPTVQAVNSLREKHKLRSNKVFDWVRTKNREQNVQVLVRTTEQAAQLIELQRKEIEAAAIAHEIEELPTNHRRMDELREHTHQQTIRRINDEERLAEVARDLGIDIQTYLRVKEKEYLNELDRTHERNKAIDEIRMVIVAELLKDHQQMAEIQRLIDSALMDIAELRRGTLQGVLVDPWAVPRMIASREESIAAWEADKRGIQSRLFQAHHRQELGGNSQKALTEGDAGEEFPTIEVEVSDKRARSRSRKGLTQ